MKSHPFIVQFFAPLPMAFACDLYQRHQRLKEGRTDPETRDMIRKALSMSKQARKIE